MPRVARLVVMVLALALPLVLPSPAEARGPVAAIRTRLDGMRQALRARFGRLLPFSHRRQALKPAGQLKPSAPPTTVLVPVARPDRDRPGMPYPFDCELPMLPRR